MKNHPAFRREFPLDRRHHPFPRALAALGDALDDQRTRLHDHAHPVQRRRAAHRGQ
jgi:hypothetical protein